MMARIALLQAAGFLAVLVVQSPIAAEAADGPYVVNCHDKTLGTVQKTLSGDCRGEVVGDEEAEAIKQKRRNFIRSVLSKPSGPKVQGKRLAGVGSGFFVATDGSLITSYHVIDDCAAVSISPTFGEMVLASSVVSNEKTDLALLHADLVPPGIAGLIESADAFYRGQAFLVGYPNQGLVTIEPVATPVEVLHRQRTTFDAPAIVIRGDVRPGNSGGPLLDSGGSVIGVVFAKVNSVKAYEATGEVVRDIGLALPTEVVQTFLDAQGVRYSASQRRMPQPEDQILDDARPFVAQIGCWK